MDSNHEKHLRFFLDIHNEIREYLVNKLRLRGEELDNSMELHKIFVVVTLSRWKKREERRIRKAEKEMCKLIEEVEDTEEELAFRQFLMEIMDI